MARKCKNPETQVDGQGLKLSLPAFTIEIPIEWKRIAGGERVIVETGPAEVEVNAVDVEALLKEYEKLGMLLYCEQLLQSKQRKKRSSDKSSNPVVLENGGSKT